MIMPVIYTNILPCVLIEICLFQKATPLKSFLMIIKIHSLYVMAMKVFMFHLITTLFPSSHI